MKHKWHAFENQIFEAFRKKERKIKKAKQLLKENKYIVYKRKK